MAGEHWRTRFARHLRVATRDDMYAIKRPGCDKHHTTYSCG